MRLINSSAPSCCAGRTRTPVGKPLSAIAPELAKALDERRARGDRSDRRAAASRGRSRCKIVRRADGHVLTFDDITQQLLDQRRAAWSDVARRIAHEIKNPLTPIQLAAERLQRRYGKQDRER